MPKGSLEWARLLGAVRTFLTEIAYRVTEYQPGTPAYFETNRVINLALIEVLWETQEISQFAMDNEPGYGSIEVQFNGLATYYLDERRRFRERAEQHTGRTPPAPAPARSQRSARTTQAATTVTGFHRFTVAVSIAARASSVK